ncbi:apolipoprotein L3-like [Brienomyrus brachyistius]|uniref:apolipoprotein L3-like n=1 Tax=Brienomyrus brachyistius TaxID=42636 RepID=UPI0020B197FD|nr:apolipoprotein L3-like [Brienomyrus brachyistius]
MQNIQIHCSEINYQVKGYDEWVYEGFAEEESNKLDNQIENGISLFLSLFESSIGILEQKGKDLRAVADGLERVHYRTTMGSLTGGVVSAIGGVASLVGLALAPVTMGASLAVTEVGVITALSGGLTSGVSNITNMVNESMDRKNIEQIIQDFTIWIEPISRCLTDLNNNIKILRSLKKKIEKEPPQRDANIQRVGCRLGMGLGVSLVPEAVQMVQAANLGRVTVKAHKAGQVAGVLTGAFSDLLVALDLYFIAQDAKEIQNINRANKESAAVKFIAEVRETAKRLEDGLDELREITKALREGDTH